MAFAMLRSVIKNKLLMRVIVVVVTIASLLLTLAAISIHVRVLYKRNQAYESRAAFEERYEAKKELQEECRAYLEEKVQI